MELTPRRRHVISTTLALLLAIESVTVVAAAAQTSVGARGPHALPNVAPAGVVLAELSADGDGAATPLDRTTQVVLADAPVDPVRALQVAETLTVPVVEPSSAAPAEPAQPSRAAMPERAPKAVVVKPPAPRPSSASSPAATGYSGRNHVWIPSLGINRSVASFACSRTRPPDNLVYRWGCAGSNNVYLMGHAYSVFKPLHDAYVAGRLKAGMKAWYADSNGRVRVYTVRWWKVTAPDANVGWAYAALGTPSMTLQTCVGSDSAHRLVVRLEADG